MELIRISGLHGGQAHLDGPNERNLQLSTLLIVLAARLNPWMLVNVSILNFVKHIHPESEKKQQHGS